MKVLRTEYFNDRIGKWIGLFETSNLENMADAVYHKNFPIFGNPETRIVMCEKTGVRKIKYKVLEVIK